MSWESLYVREDGTRWVRGLPRRNPSTTGATNLAMLRFLFSVHRGILRRTAGSIQLATANVTFLLAPLPSGSSETERAAAASECADYLNARIVRDHPEILERMKFGKFRGSLFERTHGLVHSL
jgi:hypothetical protein